MIGSPSGLLLEAGRTQPPAGGIAHIAPQMHEQRIARQRVRIALSSGEAAAAAGLRSELDEVIRRREPADLRTVLRELAAKKHLVHEGLIHEVPVVRVDLVQVAGTREEPTPFDREAVVERNRLEVGLLDVDAVVALDCRRDVAEE